MDLSVQQKMELAETMKTPGFAVFLDIGDKMCLTLLGETLEVGRAEKATVEQILAKQEEARGARKLFERWQDEANKQRSVIGGGIEEAAPEADEAGQDPIAEFRLDNELRQSAYGSTPVKS